MTPAAILLATAADPALAVQWTLAIALFLAIVHLVSPRLHSGLTGRDRLVCSLGGGMAASYVFLQLLPEVDRTHQPLGERVHAIMLAGFIAFYALERLVAVLSADHGRDTGWGAAVHFGSKFVYNGLIVYTMQENLPHGAALAVLYSLALSFHLLYTDYHLAREHPREFHRWGRHLLAIALVSGWLIAALTELQPMSADILLTLLCGSTLFEVFRHEIPDFKQSSLGWFCAGAGFYGALSIVVTRYG